MKRIVSLIVTLLLLNFPLSAYAESSKEISTQDTTSVLFVLYDRNKSVWMNKSQNKSRRIITAATEEKLTQHNFVIINDIKYYERLHAFGTDIPSIEKDDIITLYQDVACDYVLLVELLPKQKTRFDNAAHVKLLDMKNQKYLHNSGIHESTKWGGLNTATRKIGERIQEIITNKLVLDNKNYN